MILATLVSKFKLLTRRSQPYWARAEELLRAGCYRELASGALRVGIRAVQNNLSIWAQLFGRMYRATRLRGRRSINAKTERIAPSGAIERKITISYPSPAAPILASIVIPCFNYGRYVVEAVQSARRQSLRPVEIIVIDDGSTDIETQDVLAELEAEADIVVVRQQNQGLPSARNTGILLAHGEYICCLDADDTIEPTYLEMLIAVMEADPSVGFAYSWVHFFGDEDRVWQTRDFEIEEALITNHSAASAVFRRDDWLACGGYNPAMCKGYEDWDFWLRLAQLGRRGKAFRAPLFNHRRHGHTMTHEADAMRPMLRAQLRAGNPQVFADRGLRQQLSSLAALPPDKSRLNFLSSGGALRAPSTVPHLLVLAPWLAIGGAEVLLQEILTALQSSWRITIVTSLFDEQSAWPLFSRITTDVVPLVGAFEKETWPTIVDYLIVSRGTSIVLSHGSAFAYELMIDLKRRHPNIQVVDILHNDVPGGYIRSAIGASVFIDRHVAISERIASSLLRYGVEPQQIVTIANGVDITQHFNPLHYDCSAERRKFGLPQSRFVVAFVGRLANEKRPLEFLSCLARLAVTTDCHALMVGMGPLSATVDNAINKLGIAPRVTRVPHVARAEIGGVYAAADMLVLTSTIEGMPFTAIEAMATGCPVAATRAGDLSKLIQHGENGFLVPVESPEALVGLIEEFSNDPEQQSQFRRAARLAIENTQYTRTKMTEAYLSLFSDLNHARRH